MKRLDSMEPAAALEVLHICAEIPLPIGDLNYNLQDYLGYAWSMLGVGEDQALAWVANGEVPWCVSHYQGEKSLICFNGHEVINFLETRKFNVQTNDPSPDSSA